MLASLALALALAADPAPPAPAQGVFIVPADKDSGALVIRKGDAKLNCRVGALEPKPCFLALPAGRATLLFNGTEIPLLVPEGISWFRLTRVGHGLMNAGGLMILLCPVGAGLMVAVVLATGWHATATAITSLAALGAWAFLIAWAIAPILIVADLVMPHERLERIAAQDEPPAADVPPPLPAS